MTENTYATSTGDAVRQRFQYGTLTHQTCIHCGEWKEPRQFPRRGASPTGRALRCYSCKRRQRAAAKKAAYAAAHPEAAA
ncbi:hypothetical protein [uncultured Arthrobacter sp.]|uniref:hypothetical protein n=1 Tax=uncultured Arthrobacter sp. TaxID=114050 RepID=UPI003216BD43